MIRAALALAIACMGAACAAPYLPSDGGQVLQVVPGRSDPRQRELAVLKAHARLAPGDVAAAARLARAYIVEGRRQADPRFYGYAQAALGNWWTMPAPPGEVRLLRATLLQAIHQFDAARTDLDALVASDPGNPQAWLTLATVQAVTGHYDGAIASCRKLERLAAKAVMAACLSNPYAATGRLALAAAMVRREASGTVNAPAMQAWLAGIAAELAVRQGEVAAADTWFRQALAADPEDSYVIGAYADMLLDQRRFEEANRLLSRHHRIDALLLRHALSLKAGRGDQASLSRAIAELDARFSAAALRQESVHEREQARFELHLKGNPAKALLHARHNWLVQKEVADARILLEAAHASGQPAAARPVIDWIRKYRMEDQALQQLAGLVGKPS